MKKGFTLSEALITLIVIGIVAAVIMNIVSAAMPDQNIVAFKHVYGTIEEAISNMINYEDSYPSCIHGIINVAPSYIVVPMGFHVPSDIQTIVNNTPNCSAGTSTTGYNKFCYLFSQQMKISGDPTCPTNYPSIGNFTSQNGMYWTIVNPASSTDTQFPLLAPSTDPAVIQQAYGTRIIVDVNGPGTDKSNLPNCFGGPANLVYNGVKIADMCSATEKKTPDIYDIGVRYDGSLMINPTDTKAVAIISVPSENRKQ